MNGRYERGEEVWLVPALPTAPTAAYRQPRCTVAAPATGVRVRLVLPDGSEIETDIRNVRRTPPGLPAEPASRKPRRTLALPDGYAEVPLW